MLTAAHLTRGIFTLGAAQALTLAASAVLTALLPRYLGDVGLGKLAFALAVVGLVSILTDLGTSTFLTKEVARDPARAPSMTANALAMRIPLTVVATTIALIVVQLTGADELTRDIIVVLCVGLLIGAMAGTLDGLIRGLHEMNLLAATSLVAKLGYAGLATFALLSSTGPLGVAAASVVGGGLGLAFAVLALARRTRLTAPVHWNLWPPLVVGGLPFFTWRISLHVYGTADILILSAVAGDAVVGWYAAAYRLIAAPFFVPTIVMTVLFPALSASSTDNRTFNTIAQRAVQYVVLLTLPMGLGLALLPDKLIALLGYPDAFSSSIIPTVLLAAALPIVTFDMVLGSILNARDRQRPWALTGVAAAVLNPTLNVLAIPFSHAHLGNGAIGAAVVMVLTELFMMANGLRLLPNGVLDRGTGAHMLKCVAAGFGMAICVWLTRELPLAVPVMLGAAVYSSACLALGAVTLDELKQLGLHLAPRFGARGARLDRSRSAVP